MKTKPVILLVFGPQGSGKSTQAAAISEHFHLPVFVIGEQLRALAAKDNPLGQEIRDCQLSGKLVDDSIAEKIVREFLGSVAVDKGVVMDGFPRNLPQSQVLDDFCRAGGWRIIGVMIEISDESVYRRLSKRTETIDGENIRRPDDQPEIIAQRLAIYKEETAPIASWLSVTHKLIKINGEPSIEEVTRNVLSRLSPLLPHE